MIITLTYTILTGCIHTIFFYSFFSRSKPIFNRKEKKTGPCLCSCEYTAFPPSFSLHQYQPPQIPPSGPCRSFLFLFSKIFNCFSLFYSFSYPSSLSPTCTLFPPLHFFSMLCHFVLGLSVCGRERGSIQQTDYLNLTQFHIVKNNKEKLLPHGRCIREDHRQCVHFSEFLCFFWSLLKVERRPT